MEYNPCRSRGKVYNLLITDSGLPFCKIIKQVGFMTYISNNQKLILI